MNQITTQKPKPNLVTKLQDEAAKNPAFNAVCHVFALRERARSQISISNLRLTMFREGFKYTVEDYQNVLKFLFSVGIGSLDTDSTGRVLGLKDIKVTLQSIGLAGLSKKDKVQKFEPSKGYERVAATPAPVKEQPPKPKDTVRFPVSMSLSIGGQLIEHPNTVQLSLQEINDLLAKFEPK